MSTSRQRWIRVKASRVKSGRVEECTEQYNERVVLAGAYKAVFVNRDGSRLL